jgi:phytoene dehydrogenase-like protein
LAQKGLAVSLYEGHSTVGGGMRSAELTLPGFIHDVCSAIHPLGAGSPFFSTLPLSNYGLEWIYSDAPLAHPFDDGSAVLLERSIDATARQLGPDADAYRNLFQPMVQDWNLLAPQLLGPFRFPRHPLAMARFGWYGLRSAQSLWHSHFKERRTQALFAGLAAHSMMPLDTWVTGAFGLILGTLGHVIGWPFVRGGTQHLADALASYFQSLGGQIFTDITIQSLDQLPPAKLILCDVGPQGLLTLAGDRLSPRYRDALKAYRYGPGVFKMDWALNAPIPWKAKECARAATIHLGGTAEEIALCEQQAWTGIAPKKPYIILAQQSLFDPTRAPKGKQTAWAYCHVPSGSTEDMTERMEAQIERFAPGFRDTIIARHTMNAAQMETYNPNYVGGDINGGVQDLRQLFTRPTKRWDPYSTSIEGVCLCSASTPPGGGVHGMCGYHAAQSALDRRQ